MMLGFVFVIVYGIEVDRHCSTNKWLNRRACVHMCACVHIYAWFHVCIHAYVYSYVHAYMRVPMYMHVRTQLFASVGVIKYYWFIKT